VYKRQGISIWNYDGVSLWVVSRAAAESVALRRAIWTGLDIGTGDVRALPGIRCAP